MYGKGHKAAKVVKEVVHRKLRTQIGAGMATPQAPLGPMLGQRGINIAAFCKDFNEQTSHYIPGVPLTATAVVNPDRSYQLNISSPVTTFLVKQAAGINRGSSFPKKEVSGWITLKHVYEIALVKAKDPNLELTPLKQICEMVIGCAHSCGIEVMRDYDPAEYGRFIVERQAQVEEELRQLQEVREKKLLRK